MSALYRALCLSFLFVTVAIATRPATGPNVFNVQTLGGKPDGKTDSSNAFIEAWKRGCAFTGKSQIYVPKGSFYIGRDVEFKGPCKAPVDFVIDGTLLAPANPNDIKKDVWLSFRYITNLTISGSGTLDGQGKKSWGLNDCHKNSKCKVLAMTIGFASVNNSRIEDITSLNSKMGHMNFYNVHYFNITGVKIIAPDESPNTDGIKMGFCSNMHISNTTIGTGDDCVAILSGITNLAITNVKCGPGHGISVGSLGKNEKEKDVTGLTVRDSVFNGTDNGIRIKAWESSASKILVSKFIFENIEMNNVKNPLIIDMKYCPHPPCHNPKKGESHVQIQDLKIKNIHGTSRTKVAVNLQCSKAFPCKNVEIMNINLKNTGTGKEGGPATAVCENVQGSATGKNVPQISLK